MMQMHRISLYPIPLCTLHDTQNTSTPFPRTRHPTPCRSAYTVRFDIYIHHMAYQTSSSLIATIFTALLPLKRSSLVPTSLTTYPYLPKLRILSPLSKPPSALTFSDQENSSLSTGISGFSFDSAMAISAGVMEPKRWEVSGVIRSDRVRVSGIRSRIWVIRRMSL